MIRTQKRYKSNAIKRPINASDDLLNSVGIPQSRQINLVTPKSRALRTTLGAGGTPRARRSGPGIPPTTIVLVQRGNVRALSQFVLASVGLWRRQKCHLCSRLHIGKGNYLDLSLTFWMKV